MFLLFGALAVLALPRARFRTTLRALVLATAFDTSAGGDKRQAWDARDAALLAALFIAAFVARWVFSDGDIAGDEAWYMYLAKTFGREPGAAIDHPWFHVLNRPLYYALFHLPASAGLAWFRGFGVLLGALTPVLCHVAARVLGASRGAAALTAALTCLQRQQLEYAAHGFPDPLACDFALGAICAAAIGGGGLTFALAACSVLSKESFVALPIIVAYLRARRMSWRIDRWNWATVLVPCGFVVAVTLLGWLAPDVEPQGWALARFSWKHARDMGVGPAVWPLVLWMIARRRDDACVLWLGLPAFYLLWGWLSGRGIAPWYAIGPAALSSVAAALALTDLQRAYGARPRGFAWTIVAAACVCLSPWALDGALQLRRQLSQLHGLPRTAAAPIVLPILEQRKPDKVLLMNCFWAFHYEPLRGRHAPATNSYWPARDPIGTTTRLARAHELTIMCRDPKYRVLEEDLARQGFDTLAVDSAYWVLAPR